SLLRVTGIILSFLRRHNRKCPFHRGFCYALTTHLPISGGCRATKKATRNVAQATPAWKSSLCVQSLSAVPRWAPAAAVANGACSELGQPAKHRYSAFLRLRIAPGCLHRRRLGG